MARVAGVELPKNKRMDIALTYIYGIGRTAASKILTEAKVDGARKTDDLSAEEQVRIRNVIDGALQGRRRSAPRSAAEHQAPDGFGMLPRPASSQGIAGSRAAHPYQRAHPQGTAQDRRGQKAGAAQVGEIPYYRGFPFAEREEVRG